MIVQIFNSTLVSGPETLVLPALPNLGEPVEVVFLSETRRSWDAQKPIAYAQSLGLKTHSVPVRSRIDRHAIADLAALLQKLGAKIAHAHDVKASTYLRAASRQISTVKPKLVSTHHGVRARSGMRASLYEEFYVRFVLPNFDLALVVCTSDRELLIKRGLPPHKVKIHLNGIDRPEPPEEQRAEIAQRLHQEWGLADLGITDKTVVIGFAARIAREKRLDRVLRVMQHLHDISRRDPLFPDWRLLIFGVGPLELSLKALTKKLGISEHVNWMGYRHGLGNEMAGFDLLVSLSDAEGLPINLLEAGWAATPVFATAVDGNLDLFDLPGLVTMVPVNEKEQSMAEKLAPFIRDPELRRRSGLKFRERVKANFCGKRWLEELKDVYVDLRRI
ncbi:MAG: glycosyltransferase family 4 protein [Deltaproteobacteria bacterium]|nr:glycosyltransferase family 4 protein [Deltaproteobacteria bacterium]